MTEQAHHLEPIRTPNPAVLRAVGDTALQPPALTEEEKVINPFAATFLERYGDDAGVEEALVYVRGSVQKMIDDTGSTTRLLPEEMVRRKIAEVADKHGSAIPEDPVQRANRETEFSKLITFAENVKGVAEVFAARALATQLRAARRQLTADRVDAVRAGYGKALQSLNRWYMDDRNPT